MSKEVRYTFTGIVDTLGDVLAKSNGTEQRYIDVTQLERHFVKGLVRGSQVTLEVEFRGSKPLFRDAGPHGYSQMLDIKSITLLTTPSQ